MKKLKVTKTSQAGDKAVAIGGFVVVLLTGFFGAEPDAGQLRYESRALKAEKSGLSAVIPVQAGIQQVVSNALDFRSGR